MADGIELGKAYVQIVPSAQGIKSALTEMFDEETEGLGEQTGQSIGQELIGTLKKLIAAAGIGKIISDSINMGGALQQSLGGVETLFKDSADTVKEYAASTDGEKKDAAGEKIAMITDSGDITDESFNQITWETVCAYGDANGVEYE